MGGGKDPGTVCLLYWKHFLPKQGCRDRSMRYNVLCTFVYVQNTSKENFKKKKERELTWIAGRKVEGDGGQQKGEARSDKPLPVETDDFKEMTQTAFSQED